MSVKRITPLPSFSGVAAGVTATGDIPVGPRYHVIWLQVSDSAGSLVTEIVSQIRLKVNGKVQRTMSPAELEALNGLMGADYAAYTTGSEDTDLVTYIPIFLAEPWRKMLAAQDGLAWGTGNLSTFQIEIDINAGITSPQIAGFVEVDNSVVKSTEGVETQAGLGVICKWTRTMIPVNGTTQDITTFPRRDYYQQISFFDAYISRVEVKVENFTVRDVTKAQNDAVLLSRDMAPLAGRFDLVFDHDDVLNSALPMIVGGRAVNDFQVKLHLSSGTARNITTIVQTLGKAD